MTKLQNSIFQILSLTWCLMFWVVPAVFIWVYGGLSWSIHPLPIVFSIIFALLIGYIPMVFLGIGVVVIVESVLRGGRKGVLRISSESWHAKTTEIDGATLCSYCWSVPKNMISSFMVQSVVYVLCCIYFLYLCGYVWVLTWSRDRNRDVTIFDVMFKSDRKKEALFHPRNPDVVSSPQKKVVPAPKGPNIVKRAFVRCLVFIGEICGTFLDTITILKQKACPRIEKI